MFRSVVFCLPFLLVFGCAKEKTPEKPAPAPEPPKKGALSFRIQTFDTLGGLRAWHEGVKVLLQNGMSAVTDSAGMVSFSNLDYGVYAPSLIKDGFDGAPVTVSLNSSAMSFTLPCAMYSPYRSTNQQAYVINSDSIVLNMTLSRPVPQAGSVKLAILTSTLSGMTASTHQSADVITVNTQSVGPLNIARLPALRSFVAGLDKEQLFFVSAVPLSYGLFESNFSAVPVLVGENLFYPGNIQLKKNW